MNYKPRKNYKKILEQIEQLAELLNIDVFNGKRESDRE